MNKKLAMFALPLMLAVAACDSSEVNEGDNVVIADNAADLESVETEAQ